VRAQDVRVALRARGGLEAVDLGFQLARVWWRPLAAHWLAFVLPVGVAIVASLREEPLWALALLWWLRPLFARFPLHVLSRRLFGEAVSLRDTARELPRLFASGVWTSLVTQRLSPARTLLLPVLQLEGLRGAARRRRGALLARYDLGVALVLATVAAHVTGSVMGGLLALRSLWTPPELEPLPVVSPDLVAETIESAAALFPALYLAAISVVEPLLVAAGFAMYLNRRVQLEGWDLEVSFRALAERAEPGAGGGRAMRLAALAAALVLGAGAASEPCDPRDPASAKPCAAVVLAHPDFGEHREETRWVLRELDRDAERTELPEWLSWLPALIASAGRAILFGGLAVVLVAILLALTRERGRIEPAQARAAPAWLRGLDLDPRTLPADVVAEARAPWARGEAVAALGLLYRGALVRLGERGGLDVAASATEFECVRLVEATQPFARASEFGALTQLWLRACYGHRAPSDEQFEARCAGFALAFEAPR
jgi:hypothetical protein